MKTRYSLLQDEDCHWYIVPVDKTDEFITWIVNYGKDKIPEGVIEVGGGTPLVTFENPIIR